MWQKALSTGAWGLEKGASSGAMRLAWQPSRAAADVLAGDQVERFPELARKLASREGQALKDAARYVLNSEFNGLVIELTWERVEEALGNRFAYKPYRPRAEPLQTLAARPDWRCATHCAIQCARRLKDRIAVRQWFGWRGLPG